MVTSTVAYGFFTVAHFTNRTVAGFNCLLPDPVPLVPPDELPPEDEDELSWSWDEELQPPPPPPPSLLPPLELVPP
ncbi:hypothetical protein [Streptomyces sp. NBC_01314]|uniref:hypothetical protein n=1 Tax=Streptomyces sp. NBC_01314 TaxID=2903821 RepID=UPI00352DF495